MKSRWTLSSSEKAGGLTVADVQTCMWAEVYYTSVFRGQQVSAFFECPCQRGLWEEWTALHKHCHGYQK